MNAVLFDLDDTLYARSVPFLNAFRSTFPGCRIPDPEGFYQVYLRFTNQTFVENAQGLLSAQQMYQIRISKTAACVGISVTKEQMQRFQSNYDREMQHLQTLPDIAALLSMLQDSGLFLGLITNGPALRQRMKYRSMHLSRWIPEEHVLASGDIGHPKPDPEIFLEAASRWHLTPEETWYVGDHYENDIVPPMQLGWHTIWYDRYHHSEAEGFSYEQSIHPEPGRPKPIKPDQLVYTVEELMETLRFLIGSNNGSDGQ